MNHTTHTTSEEMTSERITSYVSLTIAALGIVGNLTCALMMRVSPMKQLSTSWLLFGVVLSDTVAVVIEALDNVSPFLPDTSVDDLMHGSNQWRCRLGTFFRETSRLVSSWLVVALSVELFLAKKGDQSRKNIYTGKRSSYVTLAVYLTSFAACFPLLVIGRVSANQCSSKYPVFYDLYTALILPVVVDYMVPVAFIIYCAACCLRSTNFGHPFKIQKQGKPTSHLQCRTLITVVSLVFVFVSLPHYVLRLLFTLERLQYSTLPSSLKVSTSSEVRLAHAIANTLLLLHYSCKFYLCYLLEPDCRLSFQSIFKFARVHTVSHTSKMSKESDAGYVNNTRQENYI